MHDAERSEAVETTDAPASRPLLAVTPSLRQYGRRAIVILFILNAIDEFDRAVLAVALDDIREHFSVSDATFGLLPLAVIFITGILSLPAGNLADRWSRRNILVLGAVIWGSAGIFASAARSFVQLFLTRALLGFGQGTIGPTHLSLLSDYYPVGVRGRVMNYWRSANPFGQIIGAVVGGTIVALAGWRWAFLAASIPGLIFGLYALTLREPKRGEADLATAVDANPLLADFLREPDRKWGFFESLSTIWRIRTLRYLIFANGDRLRTDRHRVLVSGAVRAQVRLLDAAGGGCLRRAGIVGVRGAVAGGAIHRPAAPSGLLIPDAAGRRRGRVADGDLGDRIRHPGSADLAGADRRRRISRIDWVRRLHPGRGGVLPAEHPQPVVRRVRPLARRVRRFHCACRRRRHVGAVPAAVRRQRR